MIIPVTIQTDPVIDLSVSSGDSNIDISVGSTIKGDDGFSPIVEMEKEGTVTTLTITDATHTVTSNILDGVGVPPAGTVNQVVAKASTTNYDVKWMDVTKPGDNVSTLTNDAGYLTQHQSLSNYYTKPETNSAIASHHDTTKQDTLTAGTNITIQNNVISAIVPPSGVISFNGRSGAVSPATGDYTAAMVGALPDSTFVPTKTSDLTNDSGFITNAYHDSTKQDTISDLSTIRQGAAAGATAVQPSAISNMATKTWVSSQGYAKNLGDWGITANASELNILDGATVNANELNILDGAKITTTELNYVDGVTSNIQAQLNEKQTIIDSSHKLNANLVDDTNATHKFVTSAEKTSIGTALQPNDNVSELINDAGYVTASAVSGKEDVSNKVTTMSASSTDTQYPSAKLVYDSIEDVREIAAGKNKNYVSSIAKTPALNSQDNLIEVTQFVTNNDEIIGPSQVHAGDNLYTTDTDIPDRWVSGIRVVNSTSYIQLSKLETAKVPVTDVQLNNLSILSNTVANIPIASSSSLGVMKLGNGLTDSGNGAIAVTYASNSEITSRTANKSIESRSIDYAVKAALTDGTGTAYSSSEQAAARTRIGAQETLPTVTNNKYLHVNSSGDLEWSQEIPDVSTTDKDKYLHTNSSTGALEWSEVKGIIVVNNKASLPEIGENGYIYEANDTKYLYVWRSSEGSEHYAEFVNENGLGTAIDNKITTHNSDVTAHSAALTAFKTAYVDPVVNEAQGYANAAAASATSASGYADTASSSASAASSSATSASASEQSASTYATNASTSATSASTSATTATNAASAAETAKNTTLEYKNTTQTLSNQMLGANVGSTSTLSPGSSATASASVVNNYLQFAFGIPRGKSGVQVSTTQPTDTDVDVWIKPDGSTESAAWGTITGTLSNQTDLQTELDNKLSVTAAANQIVYDPSMVYGTQKAAICTSLKRYALTDITNVTLFSPIIRAGNMYVNGESSWLELQNDANNRLTVGVNGYNFIIRLYKNGSKIQELSYGSSSTEWTTLQNAKHRWVTFDIITKKIIVGAKTSADVITNVLDIDMSTWDLSGLANVNIVTQITADNSSQKPFTNVRVNSSIPPEVLCGITIEADKYMAFPNDVPYGTGVNIGGNDLTLQLGGTEVQTISQSHKIYSMSNSTFTYYKCGSLSTALQSNRNMINIVKVKFSDMSDNFEIGLGTANIIYIYDGNGNLLKYADNAKPYYYPSSWSRFTPEADTWYYVVYFVTNTVSYGAYYGLSAIGSATVEAKAIGLCYPESNTLAAANFDGTYFKGVIPFRAATSPSFVLPDWSIYNYPALYAKKIVNDNIQMYNGTAWKQISNS